jgi:methyl-accepting chemotaxis protein
MFNNIKISTRIFLVAFIGFVGLVIVIITVINGLNKIGSEIDEIAEYQIPLNTYITELEKDILEEEILIYQLVLAYKENNIVEYNKLKESIEKLEYNTDVLILKAEKAAKKAIEHNSDEKTKEQYISFLHELEKIEKIQKKFEGSLKKFEYNLDEGKLEYYKDEFDELHHELKLMESNIIKLMKHMEKLLEHSTHQAEEDEHNLVKVVILISSIVLLLLIIISTLLIKGIIKSLNDFKMGFLEFFNFLNKETQSCKLLDDKSNDEIGDMSKVLNANINKTKNLLEEDESLIVDVKKVIELVKAGKLKQKIKLSTSNKSLEELKILINEMLEIISTSVCEDINKIENILKNYQNLDFTNRIKNTEGETAKGLNTLADIITSMLVENKSNGLTLQDSAEELLKNVDNLSASSNEAAASLEETAAAVEEITSNIAANNENVSKMARNANELNDSAEHGEKLANETTLAMDEINEQVNSINEAISVIDQIAFQTNILSLNAAVEAATAGEAGKGFAVVAQEVRNLASRSAEAAKEIKDIVEHATQKANNGKNIADKMIQGYSGLNENVIKTLELIDNVEIASKEQARGITQINDAINQLDKQTQENAKVASEAKDIAIITETIANKIVSNANEKEFEGKDSVLAKELDMNI